MPKVRPKEVAIVERQSLCLPGYQPGLASHAGDHGFVQSLARHFISAENNAAERLVQLKAELRNADPETFWTRLMEGMTELCHAQYGFVAKRISGDDHDAAVELPPLGEHGSCLLGVAFYYNDGDKRRAMHRDYKYLAWGAPCAHMKHDKVFLVPEQMSSFITHNPNALPFAAEAYIGIPLFAEEKCFAHFGLMWTQEGLDTRNLSWGYVEMMLHSLEDMITHRLLSGQGFSKAASTETPLPPKGTPRDGISTTPSLKPYAKSLSHELRTPMQGVVGMLDVMHATVQEQIEGQSNSTLRNVFKALKDHIEVVQDSSTRAVEAADNVVHAYDMNMQIPDTPLNENESPATAQSTTSYFDYKPSRLIEGSNIPVNPYKRRRSSPSTWQFGNATKIRHVASLTRPDLSPRSSGPTGTRPQSPEMTRPPMQTPMSDDVTPSSPSSKASTGIDPFPTPGLKYCNIRELIPIVIHESLRVGGRPDSAIGEPTDSGERIVVRSRSSNGHVSQKIIEWSVAEDVAQTLLVDERDLAKLVSAVFLNAVKFTEDGHITLKSRLSKSQKYLLINVADTGDGIPLDFQPQLFKPFSREDDSLTRSKEGLGLGLLVAKGLARRLGGDITLVRSAVSGDHKGSEFEIKVPMEPTDAISRSGTPHSRTPEPCKNMSSRPPSAVTPKDLTAHHASIPATTPIPSVVRTTSPSRINMHISMPAHLPNGVTSSASPWNMSSASMPIRKESFDRHLAETHPLTFLVAEDNKINRKLLVTMLGKLGYKDVYEAFDGREAVRIMRELHDGDRRDSLRSWPRQQWRSKKRVDVILMDLWMPEMDGYQATEQILKMFEHDPRSYRDPPATTTGKDSPRPPIILAVSADATDEAIHRATASGMEGFMTKPYKLMDLQRLIVEFCIKSDGVGG